MFWQLCIATFLLICMCQHLRFEPMVWKQRWISIQTQIPSHLRTMAANYPNVTGGYDRLIDPSRVLPECNGPLKVKCLFDPLMNCFRNEEMLGMEHLWYASVPVLWVSTIRPNCYIFRSFQWGYDIPQQWFQEPEVLQPGFKSASRRKTQAIIKFSQ